MSGRLAVAVAGLVASVPLLSACGGGGGSSPPAISTPPPPPPPPSVAPPPAPPPPPPTTLNLNSSEVRRSDGPLYHGAVTAWQGGNAGQGASIAIVDTGIDVDSPEFAGRIRSESRDVAGNGTLDALDDHGTNVALVAAAALDDKGVVGIAYQASILAFRADEPGSCATENLPDGDGCQFQDAHIAAGINQAVAAGADVVNLSLGGGAAGPATVRAVRAAAAAGTIVVVAAGNGGDGSEEGIDPNQPDPFAASLLQAGGGHVIIVGSVDEDGAFSSFSNRAGSLQGSFLAARGQGICCTYENGELKVTTEPDGQRYVYLFSGTSFSAPQVAGAVALLAQAFPNLRGNEIVEILLNTARDAGTSGIDAIYGRGILDIARAFQPVGTMTVAGSEVAVTGEEGPGNVSPAMGDALREAVLETLVTDSYQRPFTYSLATDRTPAELRRPLEQAVGNGVRRLSGGNAAVSVAFTVGRSAFSPAAPRPLDLALADAEQARVLAGRVAARLAPGTALAFGFAEGAQGLVAQLHGQERPAFLVAGTPLGDDGFRAAPRGTALALRQQLGRWGVTASFERGRTLLGETIYPLGTLEEDRYGATRHFGIAIDRRLGDLDIALGIDWLREDASILGATFNRALGAGGADSIFVDAQLGWHLSPSLRAGLGWREGRTRADAVGFVTDGAPIATRSLAFDVTRRGVFATDDSLGFRIAQPLRVEGGGLPLALPTAFDFATETAQTSAVMLPLTPRGRELVGEVNWTGRLWGGWLAGSVFLRRQPGHVADAADDAGVALRWDRRF